MTTVAPSVEAAISTTSTQKCKHLRVVVTRTYDLSLERATCEDCPDEVPDWKSRKHTPGKNSYRYVYMTAARFAEVFKLADSFTEDERTELDAVDSPTDELSAV